MTYYALRKFIQAIILVFVVLLVNFTILRLTPGNPYDAAQYSFLESSTNGTLTSKQQRDLALLRSRLAIYLDPAPTAFVNWVSGIVRLDFGNSVITGQPISKFLLRDATSSLWLLLLATGFGMILGITLGLYSAYHVERWQDNLIKIVTLLFVALPGWYMVQTFNNLDVQLWQLTGRTFSLVPRFSLDLTRFWYAYQPVFFLGMIILALVWGQTRTQALSVLNQDYVRTARAKGLRDPRIVLWHVFRNSLTPIISIFSGLLPFVFASQILIERFSTWQGLARPFLQAARDRDYTYLMAVFTLLVLFCVLCNFLADIAYALVDPKVKEKYQGGLRLAKVKATPIKNPVVGSRLRLSYKRIGLVVFIGAGLLTSVGIFLITSTPKPSETSKPSENSIQLPVTNNQVGTFKQLSLPSDAKILETNTRVGERKAFVPSSIHDDSKPLPQPPQNLQKESKLTIFSTRIGVFDIGKQYRQQLESEGWVLSPTYSNSISFSRVDYVFEKDDQYIWLVAAGMTSDNLTSYLRFNRRDLFPLLTNKDTFGVIVQGYNP